MANPRATVEVVGAGKLSSYFYQTSEATTRNIKRQVSMSALVIETDAKRRAPSDLGILRGSIQTQIKKGGFEAEILSDKKYAGAMENGARPHFPPPGALDEWARRHGMAGMGFLIARAISRRGLKPRPFLLPAWETERKPFINAMKKICKDLERGI